MSDLAEKLKDAKKEAEGLKDELKKKRDEINDVSLKQASNDIAPIPDSKLRVRKKLKGHLSKVYAIQWGPGDAHLVSASQDGRLIVWHAESTNKLHAIPLRSSWVMTCAYSGSGNLVACGGLDNLCSVFNLNSKDVPIRVTRELNAHTGFLSCCRFIDDKHILTSSGDTTCMLWDVEMGQNTTDFKEHTADVMALAVSPTDTNVFVSGSVDCLAKVWDIRAGKCVQTFEGHTADINTASWFPNGTAFVTGSDDSTCRMWDIRADRQIAEYSSDSVSSGVTSVDLSKSGRFLFAGSDDYLCHVWDVLKGERLYGLQGHDNRVSCVAVSPDGMGLCTGSWDSFLMVWA